MCSAPGPARAPPLARPSRPEPSRSVGPCVEARLGASLLPSPPWGPGVARSARRILAGPRGTGQWAMARPATPLFVARPPAWAVSMGEPPNVESTLSFHHLKVSNKTVGGLRAGHGGAQLGRAGDSADVAGSACDPGRKLLRVTLGPAKVGAGRSRNGGCERRCGF